jgi:hypothetical protein
MTTELLDTAPTTSEAGSQDATPPADTTAPEAGQGAPATASADNPPAAESDAAPAAVEYEPFQLPEGMTADEEILGEFKTLAKEKGLSQEDAQKFVAIQAKVAEKQQAAVQAMKAQWVEASKTDKEFGGDALEENLGVAKRALDTLATPQLRQLLNESGLGNHPEVIRHFVRVGKAISEDGRVVTGGKATTPSSQEKRMFPNMN